MKTQGNIITASLALAALVLAGAGCGTTAGYKQADKTGEGIAELRDEVVNLKKSVDGAVKALDTITTTAATDPRKAYEGYAKAVKSVESASSKATKRAEDMRADSAAYFKKWQDQLAAVKNPEIRKLAEERKAKLQQTFDGIKTAAVSTKEAFPPFLADLKDLNTVLGNDLTIQGVDAARGVIAKTKASGVKLQGAMDGLVAELNTVAATITPAKASGK